MRTTLTLEPDVAARLERYRRRHGRSLKGLINEVLRAGFDALDRSGVQARERQAVYRIQPSDSPCTLADLDDIGEVLAVTEGEDHT